MSEAAAAAASASSPPIDRRDSSSAAADGPLCSSAPVAGTCTSEAALLGCSGCSGLTAGAPAPAAEDWPSTTIESVEMGRAGEVDCVALLS